MGNNCCQKPAEVADVPLSQLLDARSAPAATLREKDSVTTENARKAPLSEFRNQLSSLSRLKFSSGSSNMVGASLDALAVQPPKTHLKQVSTISSKENTVEEPPRKQRHVCFAEKPEEHVAPPPPSEKQASFLRRKSKALGFPKFKNAQKQLGIPVKATAGAGRKSDLDESDVSEEDDEDEDESSEGGLLVLVGNQR